MSSSHARAIVVEGVSRRNLSLNMADENALWTSEARRTPLDVIFTQCMLHAVLVHFCHEVHLRKRIRC